MVTRIRSKHRCTDPPQRQLPRRVVTESSQLSGSEGPALRVDKEKKIIYGVKVLGRYSPNNHGFRDVTEGTEYTLKALNSACSMYEGKTVFADHPKRGSNENRSVRDAMGTLRNPRVEGEGQNACVRADLHYLGSHELSEAVVEDVERRLGVFGLSHNAVWDKGEIKNGRLVIESLEEVRSVDLVDRPATNRNLWESRMPVLMTSLRKLLEGKSMKFDKPKKAIIKQLIEGDEEGYADAPMKEDEVTELSPEDQIGAGFKAAIVAVLDDDSLDAKGKLKKIGDFLKAHEKLMGSDEPDGDEVEEEEEDKPAPKTTEEEEEDDEDKKKDSSESLRYELNQLKRKDECRELCESLEFTPTKVQLKALMGLEGKDRKDLAESFAQVIPAKKGTASFRQPKSSPPKSVRESQELKKVAPDAKTFASFFAS